MSDPKVLVFDIETFPMLVRVWDIREQYISPGQIEVDWSVAAWGAKWLHAPASEVIYRDTRHQRNLRDDRAILRPLWKLLDQADVVITQNGTAFDSKKLNARFIELGMAPPSHYDHWDTLRVSRQIAKFSSNRLAYLADRLCTKYKKLKHEQYPGDQLWIACLARDPRAWDAMRKYNIHDVLSTEELYTKLRAWAPQSVPVVYHAKNPAVRCETCGQTGGMEKHGRARNKKGLYQRYKCTKCGTWKKGEKIKEPTK